MPTEAPQFNTAEQSEFRSHFTARQTPAEIQADAEKVTALKEAGIEAAEKSDTAVVTVEKPKPQESETVRLLSARILHEFSENMSDEQIKMSAADQIRFLEKNAELGQIDYKDAFALIKLLRSTEETMLRKLLHEKTVEAEKATEEAGQDYLTKVLNRRGFDKVVANIAETMNSHNGGNNHDLGILEVDIDHFKTINDTYGHDAGDAVLIQLGTLLGENIQSKDAVARFGGEEFFLLLNGTKAEEVGAVAERKRQEIADFPFTTDKKQAEVYRDIAFQTKELNLELSTTDPDALSPEDPEYQKIVTRHNEITAKLTELANQKAVWLKYNKDNNLTISVQGSFGAVGLTAEAFIDDTDLTKKEALSETLSDPDSGLSAEEKEAYRKEILSYKTRAKDLIEKLRTEADNRLYFAKENGRNRVVDFEVATKAEQEKTAPQASRLTKAEAKTLIDFMKNPNLN